MPTKILLLSDTHGHMDDVILKYAAQADEIWHAGDIGKIEVTDALKAVRPLRAVSGNIDGQTVRSEFGENERFSCEGVSVWITHIGGYPGNFAPGIKKELQSLRPNIFICGHSHILKVMFDRELNVLCLNPGAAGKSGFHTIRTMLRFVIDGNDIRDMEVVELGNRH